LSALPPKTDIAQKNTIRLIPTGRLKQPVLLALAANHGALEDLAELEGATSGRLMAQRGGLFDLDPRELVFGAQGHTFINAAFTYTRPGGSRFNGEERGAWYCGFAVETSLAEVAYHLTRELDSVGRFENVTDYAELIADFIGAFHDLRGDEFKDSVCLGADISGAYPAGQALAARLRLEEQGIGILYPSVRHPGGTCLAAFHPGLVQNLRQGGVWRLEWRGTREAEISRM
jgi:RES domain-containing protein